MGEIWQTVLKSARTQVIFEGAALPTLSPEVWHTQISGTHCCLSKGSFEFCLVGFVRKAVRYTDVILLITKGLY
jgi:hypothetical protein